MRILAALVLLAAAPAGAQVVTDMTPELVRQAIADEKNPGCYSFGGGSGWGVTQGGAYGCFTTPYSRVARAAQDARKTYKPFTEADVTADMIAPEVRVHAFARNNAQKRGPRIINVEAVVFMPEGSKDRAAAILPATSATMTDEFKNGFGATFEGRSVTATFPLSVLDARNEIRVVFDSGVCGIKQAKDCGTKLKLDKVR